MFHPWHVHRREFHWSSSWRVMQSEKGTGRNWCKWQKWRQPFAWAKSKWLVMRPLWEPMWKMVVQWLWLRKILTSRRWHWMQFLLCSCIAFLMKSMSWWWPMLCGIAVLTDVDLPDVFGQVLFECLCDKTCFIRGTKWVEDRKWTCEGAFCSDFTLPNQFASSTSSWRPPTLPDRQHMAEHAFGSQAVTPLHQLSWLSFFRKSKWHMNSSVSCSSFCNDLTRYKGEPSNPRGSL